MGSIITLSVGKLELDWGKNLEFNNHSRLFLPSDVKDIPYYYADNVVELKKGYSRKLKDVKRRLELLGYPLVRLESLYKHHLSFVPDYYPKLPFSYEEFVNIMLSVDPSRIEFTEDLEVGDFDPGEFISRYLFQDDEFNKHTELKGKINQDIGLIIENFDSCFLLRLLIENPKNSDLELQWRHADVIDGGWIDENEIYEQLEPKEKILIVTEGSSDSFILRKALELLFPDIVDFFYFVDMEENYPFTGTGNLYRFCQGLSSMKTQNNVLIIYDNDVEGNNKYNLTKKLELPSNMKIAKLPEYPDFDNFSTLGPNGENKENINGKAVSIECFLDLSFNIQTSPRIRWTSFDKDSGSYQGCLINKDDFVRKFLKLKQSDTGYNFEKLNYLIDYLYKEWISR